MGNVISLHAERWIEGVFESHGTSSAIRVDVSTKGRVRFVVANGAVSPAQNYGHTLSMEEMAELGEALSVAYKEDDDG